MKLRGTVIRRNVAPGSKSEREAVVLLTDQKQELILRKRGGNPFFDPSLEELVGKQIQCEGTEHGQTLIMESWNILDDGEMKH
jgi:hypothetical protein